MFRVILCWCLGLGFVWLYLYALIRDVSHCIQRVTSNCRFCWRNYVWNRPAWYLITRACRIIFNVTSISCLMLCHWILDVWAVLVLYLSLSWSNSPWSWDRPGTFDVQALRSMIETYAQWAYAFCISRLRNFQLSICPRKIDTAT